MSLATDLDFDYVTSNFSKYNVAESFYVDESVQVSQLVQDCLFLQRSGSGTSD